MGQLVYEGTWEDIARHAPELKGHRVRLTVVTDEAILAAPIAGTGNGHLYFGMFKGNLDVTDDDFRSAEWRGEDVDI